MNTVWSLFGPHAMSDLGPEYPPTWTLADHSDFMGSRPSRLSVSDRLGRSENDTNRDQADRETEEPAGLRGQTAHYGAASERSH